MHCIFNLINRSLVTNGPRHVKTCLLAYAESEDPDQPAHPRSLIRASLSAESLDITKYMNGEQMPR